MINFNNYGCFGVESNVGAIVDGGAVPALVKHLQPPVASEGYRGLGPLEHEVEKECAFVIGLLAIKVIIFVD